MAKRPRTNHQEAAMAAVIDQRTLFGEISSQIAPILAQALKEGWDRDKLMSHPKIELLMAARQATIAITDPDAGKAMAAIKDATDRRHGKATEKLELTGKLSGMNEQQLDSVLITKLKGAADKKSVQ